MANDGDAPALWACGQSRKMENSLNRSNLERNWCMVTLPALSLPRSEKQDPLSANLCLLCFLNTGRWTNSKPPIGLKQPKHVQLYIPAVKRGSYHSISVHISSYLLMSVHISSYQFLSVHIVRISSSQLISVHINPFTLITWLNMKPGDMCLMIKIENFCKRSWNPGYRVSSNSMHV